MKRRQGWMGVLVGAACLVSGGRVAAAELVRDGWLDGERDFPAAPAYSEFGVDGDADGDIESAWFRGGAGTFDPVGAGGPLRLTQNSASSSSLTTYFTPEGSEVTLANPGDYLKLTWQFTVSGFVLDNTSQGLRLAVVNSPADARVTSNGSPGNAAYTGYAMFLNMASNVFTHSSPFQLLERADPVTASALLSSGGSWSSLASGGTSGNASYLPGVDYTFTMQLTLNGDGGLDISAAMAGEGLNGAGLMSVDYTDATPNGDGFSFDTFQFRPDGNDRSWDVIDTSLFQVEFVPEPTSAALILAGLGLLLANRRTRKS